MAQFYRIVKSNPPTEHDFCSAQALGRPRPNRYDHLAVYDGVSVYDSEAEARATARQFPKLGSFIARLDVPDSAAVRWEQTLKNPSHHTLWAPPDVLLALVVEVHEIDPPVV